MPKIKRDSYITAGMIIPFVLVTTLFFMWGIPNNLNGVLIKQFMKSMELSPFQAGLIQSAFYMGYFVLAVPAAIKEKVGLYGFTKPVMGPMMPPVDYYLSKSVESIKGDERNIAVLARVYNNFPLDYIKK